MKIGLERGGTPPRRQARLKDDASALRNTMQSRRLLPIAEADDKPWPTGGQGFRR
jgi:hypothetical protein